MERSDQTKRLAAARRDAVIGRQRGRLDVLTGSTATPRVVRTKHPNWSPETSAVMAFLCARPFVAGRPTLVLQGPRNAGSRTAGQRLAPDRT